MSIIFRLISFAGFNRVEVNKTQTFGDLKSQVSTNKEYNKLKLFNLDFKFNRSKNG